MNNENEMLTASEPVGLLDQLLRSPSVILAAKHYGKTVTTLSGLAIGGVGAYGLIVGSFNGGDQWWAAPAKLTFGFLISALMCFPSFYIFSCMSGTRASGRDLLMLLTISLATAGVILVAALPIAWIFTQASDSIVFIGTLHLIVWGTALIAMASSIGNGLRFLDAKSFALVRLWMIVFMLVTVQMTTTLRPVIGQAETLLPSSKKFFMTHWLEVVGK